MSENNEYTNYNEENGNSYSYGDYYSSTSGSSSSYSSGDSQSSYSSQNSYDSQNSYGSQNSYDSQSSYGSQGAYSSQNSYSGSSGSSGGFSGGGHGGASGKTPKKRGGFLKKAAAIALSAVLFGSVAGSAMVGVQYAAQKAGIIAEADAESGESQTAIKLAESTNSGSSTSTGSNTALADVSDIVDKVLPSVVAITNSQLYENYAREYGWSYWYYGYGSQQGESQQEEIEAGSGSGIIIGQNDTELLIVTNYHVIEDADSLTITFIDESTAKASVKGTDSENDLAVVAVTLSDLTEETKNEIAIATMDTSDNCKVGQGVIAIGNALGYGQSITVGYISALNREVETSEGTVQKLLQTDAAINPGNSGGALVNTSGDIIGINSAKYSDTDVEGMGFAIPISAVHEIIDDLMNQTTKVEVDKNQRGYLGIQCLSTDSTSYNMPEGVYVVDILKGGAAASSDLQVRDIITKINGTSVTTQEALTEQLKYYAIGDTVTLTVSRQNGAEYESLEIEVTLQKQVQ